MVVVDIIRRMRIIAQAQRRMGIIAQRRTNLMTELSWIRSTQIGFSSVSRLVGI